MLPRLTIVGRVNNAATLRARALTRIYRTGEFEVHALCRVDLTLGAGEPVVLLGPTVPVLGSD